MTGTVSLSRSTPTTTSADRAKSLSQFYTKPDLAADCIRRVRSHLGDRPVDLWIEPSAGEGAFLHQLPTPCLGIDIDPKAADIASADFLSWEPPARSSDGLVVVIGNPPFGKNASDAVRFFNRASSFCDVMAFILPRTVEKASVRRRLDKRFHLKKEWVLDDAMFVHKGVDVRLPAVFQIWERENALRVDPAEPTEHPDFVFLKDQREAHIALQRVGADAGCVRTNFAARSASSNYFIRVQTDDRPVVDILRGIDFSTVKARCAGNPSIAKTEIVRLYREQLEARARTVAAPQPVSDATSPVVAMPDRTMLGLDGVAAGAPSGTQVPTFSDSQPTRASDIRTATRTLGRTVDRARTHRAGGADDRRRRGRGHADRSTLRARAQARQATGSGGDNRGPVTRKGSDRQPPCPRESAYPVDLTKVVISNGDLLRGNWVEGHLRSDPSYCFEVEVYPMGSRFGIDGGRISMLRLRFIGTRPDDTEEVWYERGWEGDPPERHHAAIKAICRAFPEPTEAQHGAHLAAQVRAEIEHRSRDRGPAEHAWGSRR
jgi:predicted RNA methylase